MIILAVIGLVVALFLAFSYIIFIAYNMTSWDKCPKWLDKTYDFMFGWL